MEGEAEEGGGARHVGLGKGPNRFYVRSLGTC